MSEAPLHGYTVAEFGNLIAAPYAGMLLADLGARVIKVEPPTGDLGRNFGPFENGESVFFMAANRGKESISLDTRDPDARRAIETLVARSDAIIHNLRHGAMERMGLGYADCVALNNAIVYVEVAAFGSSGPYVERTGIDVVFQGESGMISITGAEGDGPRKTATTIGDYVAGTNAALSVAAALAERPRRPRHAAVSLRDGLMAVQSGWNALHFASGDQPRRTGTRSPFLAPNQVFEAGDRQFTLAIVSDRHFGILCEALGRSDLVQRFPTNEDRMAGEDTLATELGQHFRQREAAHWTGLLGGLGLPCGPVLTIEEAFDDPQSQHNQMSVEYDHPIAGTVRATGSPIQFDGAPARSRGIPPTLGEHTRDLLIELGIEADIVDRMQQEGKAVLGGR